MNKIAVFYLLRKKNDRACFFEFIESYKIFHAGQDHDFFIILKGFTENENIHWVHDHLKGINFKVFYCSDVGFDIYAYFYSSKKIRHEYVMFINSFSIISSKNWLAKIFKHINQDVIAVGCSGSWESVSSSFFYNKIYINRNILLKSLNLIIYPIILIFFPKFPSGHLRTNAFLINRKFFLDYKFNKPFKLKIQSWFFENGRKSLSRFIKSKGKSFGLVDKNGIYYNELKFNKSKTFADLDNDNSLIKDNQINSFKKLNTKQKKIKSLLNWDLNKLYN